MENVQNYKFREIDLFHLTSFLAIYLQIFIYLFSTYVTETV